MRFEKHTIPKPTIEGREDLRSLLTFTIDPETAKDFDDAISVRREREGHRAWIHIADVSFFLPAGSSLDRGAAERSFSFYVPGRVAPMLPPELSDDACSLRAHVDRLCVTVEVPFSPELEAGRPRFYRSVVRSDARLTYGQAERILVGQERADAPLVEALKQFIPRVMKLEETPGLNLAVALNGAVIWEEGFGYADIDRKIPMTPSTVSAGPSDGGSMRGSWRVTVRSDRRARK